MNKSIRTILLLSILLSSCSITGNEEIKESNLKFATTDDSELFFKNVRQLYYDLEELEPAKLNVYRLKKRTDDNVNMQLTPTIVWNWRFDEAYLILEFNPQIVSDSLSVIMQKEGKNREIIYTAGDKMDQLKFATEIYNGIVSQNEITVWTDEKEIPLFSNSQEREVFRITMVDYYQLINVL